MNKVSPLSLFLLTSVLLAPSTEAQSIPQDSRPSDKTATAYKSPERRTQVGTETAAPGTSEDNGKPGSSQASIEAQKLYDSGMNYLQAGKLEDAIVALRESSRLRPEDAQTHYSLGMAYSQSKFYKEAAESFRRAVKYRPDWPEANFRVGMMSYVLGRKSQSFEAYNKLLKLNSPLATTLYKVIGDENSPPQPVQERASTGREQEAKPPAVIPVSSPVTTKNAEVRSSAPAVNERQPVTPAGNGSAVKETGATTQPASGTALTAVSTPAPVTEQPLTNIYRIGVGDILDIRVLNLVTPGSTLYTVVNGGLIDLPITGGPLLVAGLTTDEIQARIAGELRRRAFDNSATVTVGVRQYSSHPVIVTGLVNSPGTRFLRREAVPLYVIMAEVQPRLDAGRVTILRAGVEKQTIDLNDSTALNVLIRGGDVINVSARPAEFYYIGGRINYPGQKPFQAGITLLQAILAAGGTSRQNDNHIDLSREGSDSRLTTTRYNLKDIKSGKTQDPRLQPGDRIEVMN